MDRRALLLAFVLGLVIGALAMGLAVGRGGEEASGSARSAGTEERSPSAPRPVEMGGLAAPNAPAAPNPGTSPSSSEGRGVPATPVVAAADEALDADPGIEVVVTGAAGIPDDWTGTAYALPAGAPGADADGGVARIPVRVGVPARLKVPIPGLYDVGVTWPGAAVLVRDVAVDERTPARADVPLPASAPITVVVEGEGRAREGAPKVGGSVRFVPRGEGPARGYPGRGQRLRSAPSVTVEAFPGRGTSPPLPLSSTYDVESEVWVQVEMKFGDASAFLQMGANDERLVPSTAVVKGGDEVRLVREPVALASWHVRFVLDPQPWPAPALRLRLQWSFADGTRIEDGSEGQGAPPTALPHVAQSGAPGPARLAWSGANVAAGEATATLTPGSTDTEVVVRYDPRGGAGADLVLDASALPSDAPLPTAIGWGGSWPAGSAADPDRLPYIRREPATSRRHVLALEYREGVGVLAFAGPWVSRPSAPPSTGDWRPTFERGGHVVVVADPTPDPSLGALLVRRTDGVPLLATIGTEGAAQPTWAAADQAVTSRHEIAVLPGTILGPFPPGDVAFEAHLGSVPLPPATIRVRAGRVTTWEVRWRTR